MLMRSWIRRLFSRPVVRSIRKTPHRARPALEVLEDRCVPSTIVVNNPTDTPVTGEIDLRQAITQANSRGGVETITFNSTVFNTAKTITLSGGPLVLSDPTGRETITGPAAALTVSGGGRSRVFSVKGTSTFGRPNVALSNLTISGSNSGGLFTYSNTTTALSNCTVSGNSGGGLVSQGTTTLTNCTISGNSGGGLVSQGTTTLTNCTISGNTSSGNGGGLVSQSRATLTNCTVSGNSASGNGGGLDIRSGSITLTNCTVSGNSAGKDGGGLYASASSTTTFTNGTTVSSNSANLGAGLCNSGGTITLNDSTIKDNTTTAHGIGGGLATTNGGRTTLIDSTVSGNSAAKDGGGLYTGASSTTSLTNGSTVSGNSANLGAGLCNSGGTTTLTDSTVSDNTTTSQGVGGGVATTNSGTTTLIDTTVSGNSAGKDGGGLYSNGTTTLGNVTVTGNSTGKYGGGLANFGGSTTLTLCTVSGNSAVNGGGGLDSNGGTTTLTNSTVSGNSTKSFGGGLANSAGASLMADGCTFSDNSALEGGGLSSTGGTIALTNCTLSGNSAGAQGGGLLLFDTTTATLTNCTVSGNSAKQGGGLISTSTTTLANTIVAGNTALTGPDLFGVFLSLGNNLIGKTNFSSGWVGSDLTGTNAHPLDSLLGPLGNYGGPTQTMDLLPGSPAIDAGASGPGIPGIDQRGALRGPAGLNAGSAVDIGAYKATSSYLVTSTDDSNAIGTLRSGVGWANLSTNTNPANLANPAPNTVVFDTTGVFATPQTITLSPTLGALELANASAAEAILGTAAGLTISGGGTSRVFQVNSGVTAIFSSLTISGGSTTSNGGGLYNDGGTTSLIDVTVSGNSAASGGGLFDAGGSTTLTDSTVSGNSASVNGGGLDNYGLATLTLTNCTVSGNAAANNGGGVYSYNGTTTLSDCTISGNSAGTGGGLDNVSGTVNIGNTIVAVNTASSSGPDVFGAFASQGNNLIGETDGSSGWVSFDLTGTSASPLKPLLGPLNYYGGPIQTMALLTGSPAIDAGNNALIPSGITTDQRGFPRVVNGIVDIGSFEVQGESLVVNTISVQLGKLDLRGAVNLADVLPGAQTITFDPTIFASAQTITLPSGQLELSNTSGTETITAPAAGVTVSGGGLSRVFQVDGGVMASLSGLTITGGSTTGNGGGLYNDGGTTTLTNCTVSGNSALYGGGLENYNGTTTLTNCTVSGNSALYGGGLANYIGTTTLTNCTVSGNSATNGGGLDNDYGKATLTNCTVSGNVASGNGGGLNSSYSSTTTLTYCTVSGNSAGDLGGGVNNYGYGATLTLTNCTVSANSASEGGGLANHNGYSATLTLTNCTVSGNSAYRGGGGLYCGDGTTTLTNCSVSGNSATGYGGGGLYNGAGTTTLTNCSVSGNSAVDSGGGLSNYRYASLTLTNCTVSGNSSGDNGGGLANAGGVTTLTNCNVSGNSAYNGGGGLSNDLYANGAKLTLTNCTVSGNSATGSGGGLYTSYRSTTTLLNCTVCGNSAGGVGGGLDNNNYAATLTLTNCTISGNSASGSGGGLYNKAYSYTSNTGFVSLTNCTVSGNSASGSGGGLVNAGKMVALTNTIVAENTAVTSGPDVFGTFDSLGHNLIGSIDGSSGWFSFDLTGTSALPLNPLLGPLGYYGGPTQTMALLPGSPAIDAGASGPAIPATDQRGALRGPAGLNAGSAVDIGAYEASSSYLVTSAIDSTDAGTLRAAVGWANVSSNANPTNLANPAPNTVVFDNANVFATPQTITLSPSLATLELSNASTAETITGTAAGLTISGGGTSRVFQVDGGVTASLSGLTISGGSTTGNGGGLYNNGGTTTLTDVTVSGNSAFNGGGLFDAGGTTTLTNCTLSGNSAANNGGGLDNVSGATMLTNCTVSANSASLTGGGLYNANGTVSIGNTIVAGNTAPSGSDAFGTFASQGHNLIGKTDGSSGWVISDRTGTIARPLNPKLAPLGYYGGPTQTMLLLPGSPAVNTGNNALVPTGITSDQRGFSRIVNGSVDIGAFEVQGGPLVVNTINVQPGTLDLRGAIDQADILPGAHTVTFDPTVFAKAQTITLPSGQLDLSNTSGTETITGPKAGVTINGGGTSRVFQVESGVTARLSGLTITGGSTTGNGGGLYNDGGTTSLTDITISGNSATNGGGLVSEGTTTLASCTISGNSATNGGGGLLNVGGTTTLIDCTISGNSAGGSGGGLLNLGGTTTLTNSTFSGNYASGNGGGLANSGLATLTLTNCTFNGNSATGNGGGLYFSNGTTTLNDCTVSGNSAGDGGGLDNGSGTVNLGNTIVAVNTASTSEPDVFGPFASQGNNLIGATDGSSGWVGSDLTGTSASPLDPLLAPLGYYGGPIQTMALLTGSPAIDAGNNALIPAGVTTDQRGFSRVVNGIVDIGAFEVQADQLLVNTISVQFGKLDLRGAVDLANVLTGAQTITFDPTVFAKAQTIALASGQLELSNTSGMETIMGPAAGVTVNGGGTSRVFQVDSGVTASLSGLTITGGSTTRNGGGLYNDGGTTTLTGVTVSGNTAYYNGGGVDNYGSSATLTLTNCIVSGNSSSSLFTSGGGGVCNDGGTSTLTDCILRGNSTSKNGGGILINKGSSTLTSCTLKDNTSVDGGGLFNNGGTATLLNCNVSGNSGSFRGGGLMNSQGTTTLNRCLVSGNSTGVGGGVYNYNYGTATLSNCTVSGNSASGDGGGVETNSFGSTTILNRCTVSGNSAGFNGGALFNGYGCVASLTNCTVSGNSAGFNGGALANYSGTISGTGSATLTNCTVSGNSASRNGGALYNSTFGPIGSPVNLSDCTFSGNSAAYGGGLDNVNGTVTIGNTIVAGNTATSNGPDALGTVASQGNNLIGATDGSSGWVSSDLTGTRALPVNPLLAPLGKYGGPMQTMALLPGSPAIDAGSNALIPAGIASDERGLTRIVNSIVDIGAFESTGFTISVTSGSGQSTGVLTVFTAPLVATVTAYDPSEPVAGGRVTFTPSSSGASATLSGSPAPISAAGTASVTAAANGFVGSYTVSAKASGIMTAAKFNLTNDPLILALDPSASGALSLSGEASINLDMGASGVVYVDSSSSAALSAGGNAQVTAASIDIHGGVQTSGSPTLSPAPVTGAAVLGVVSLPSPSTTGMTNHGSFSLSGNSSATIQPGIYSQISVSANAQLTMSSGIYIIEGGGFSVLGSASVGGSGVTIVNAGSNYSGTGGTYGGIMLGGNGTCDLSPATTGPYAGIVFFQPLDNSRGLTVTANGSGISGTIYAPGAQLSESGSGVLNVSLIVDSLTISGNGIVRYLSSAPHVGSFTASPNPVTSGGSVNLTASNITDGNPNSTTTQVAFYYFDSNGTYVLLGNVTQSNAGAWALTVKINLPPGSYTLFAQAEDSYGVFGNPRARSLTVQ